MAVNLTSSDFDSTVNDSGKPVLIDFWASWCGPCRMLGPVLDELTKEYEGKAIIAKVNVDEEQSLAQKYGIMSIPAVMVFKDGKVVDSSVGVRPKAYYVGAIDKAL
jgi:thioredoxin 1